MQSYEIEIKSLLGDKDRAEALLRAMKAVDPSCELLNENTQLNHYFEGGRLEDLAHAISPHLSGVGEIRLDDIIERAGDYSIRTRDKNGAVYFVIKASVGDDTSANGIARIELEERVPLSLEELDKVLLDAGFSYQAKWSRERQEYVCKSINVTIDKNAGYGYLGEFERIVDEPSKVDAARAEVKSLMSQLGVEELPQDRLERMFAHYNKNWPSYYGTDKIFTIE